MTGTKVISIITVLSIMLAACGFTVSANTTVVEDNFGTGYATIEEAIAAATDYTVELRLVGNIADNVLLYAENPNKEVTLDLNGYSINYLENSVGIMNIKDTSAAGTGAINSLVAAEKMNIYGGTFSALMCSDIVNIYGGTFAAGGYIQHQAHNKAINIYGGTYNTGTEFYTNAEIVNPIINIFDGEFTNINVNVPEGTEVNIYGGLFSNIKSINSGYFKGDYPATFRPYLGDYGYGQAGFKRVIDKVDSETAYISVDTVNATQSSTAGTYVTDNFAKVKGIIESGKLKMSGVDSIYINGFQVSKTSATDENAVLSETVACDAYDILGNMYDTVEAACTAVNNVRSKMVYVTETTIQEVIVPAEIYGVVIDCSNARIERFVNYGSIGLTGGEFGILELQGPTEVNEEAQPVFSVAYSGTSRALALVIKVGDFIKDDKVHK